MEIVNLAVGICTLQTFVTLVRGMNETRNAACVKGFKRGIIYIVEQIITSRKLGQGKFKNSPSAVSESFLNYNHNDR